MELDIKGMLMLMKFGCNPIWETLSMQRGIEHYARRMKWPQQKLNEMQPICKDLYLGINKKLFCLGLVAYQLETIEEEKVGCSSWSQENYEPSMGCGLWGKCDSRMNEFDSRQNTWSRGRELLIPFHKGLLTPCLEACVQCWPPMYKKE